MVAPEMHAPMVDSKAKGERRFGHVCAINRSDGYYQVRRPRSAVMVEGGAGPLSASTEPRPATRLVTGCLPSDADTHGPHRAVPRPSVRPLRPPPRHAESNR